MHQTEDLKTQKQALIDAAIDNNQPELLEQVLKINAEGLHEGYENQKLVVAATRKNSIPALHYLIKYGVSIKHIGIPGKDVSIQTLSFLLAHGWDINWAGEPRSYQDPFMWSCIQDRAYAKFPGFISPSCLLYVLVL